MVNYVGTTWVSNDTEVKSEINLSNKEEKVNVLKQKQLL